MARWVAMGWLFHEVRQIIALHAPFACAKNPCKVPKLSLPEAWGFWGRVVVQDHTSESPSNCPVSNFGCRPQPCVFLQACLFDVRLTWSFSYALGPTCTLTRFAAKSGSVFEEGQCDNVWLSERRFVCTCRYEEQGCVLFISSIDLHLFVLRSYQV